MSHLRRCAGTGGVPSGRGAQITVTQVVDVTRVVQPALKPTRARVPKGEDHHDLVR